MKGTVLGIMVMLVLFGVLMLPFYIPSVKATGTIYIRADGSIEGTTYIQTTDNVTYVFTADVADSIVVERNNIVIDGSGYTLQGGGSGRGIDLSTRTNVTVQKTKIKAFDYGLWLNSSSNYNSISRNDVTANTNSGIWLNCSLGNTISGNNVTNNYGGIVLEHSVGNSISGNKITANNSTGILLYSSSNSNSISSNNVTANNSLGIRLSYSSNNTISQNNVRLNPPGGIWLMPSSNNNTISKNNVTENNGPGILLHSSSNYNNMYVNKITNNSPGIGLGYSASYNRIFENNLRENSEGVQLYSSSNYNIISQNNITTSNIRGIRLSSSSNNMIYHNNFADDSQVPIDTGSMNVWDDGYPSGGNYWSGYSGTDGDGDGLGDTPYIIFATSQDNYPLVNPWTPPDIAVTNVKVAKAQLVEGSDLSINITLVNQGDKIEVFTVTALLNGRPVESFQNVLLKGGTTITLNTSWGPSRGSISISVYMPPLTEEIDIVDNTLTDGTILVAPIGRGRNLAGPIIPL